MTRSFDGGVYSEYLCPGVPPEVEAGRGEGQPRGRGEAEGQQASLFARPHRQRKVRAFLALYGGGASIGSSSKAWALS